MNSDFCQLSIPWIRNDRQSGVINADISYGTYKNQ